MLFGIWDAALTTMAALCDLSLPLRQMIQVKRTLFAMRASFVKRQDSCVKAHESLPVGENIRSIGIIRSIIYPDQLSPFGSTLQIDLTY
jgi:hypothetical protein